MSRPHRSLHVVFILATSLLVAACSPGFADGPSSAGPGGEEATVTEAYQQYSGLTGQDRTDRLLADAVEEGAELDIYTSNTDIGPLVEGFQETYPDITVNAFRSNSETVLQRVLQESSAGRAGSDVVATNDAELRALDAEGVFGAYDGPGLDGLPPEARFAGWQAERFNAFVIGWNSEQVSADEAPRSITELADPKWSGRVSLELGDWDWYATVHTYLTTEKGMGPEQVDEMFRRIVANARVTKGHTVQGELLSAGQFAVATSVYSHTVDNAARSGAPVAWRPISDPVILRPNGFGLMAEPEHPAAALLWADWVLTDGQRLIVESNRIPAATDVPGTESPLPPEAPAYTVPDDVVADSQRWNSAYDALLRGVPETS